MLRWGLVLLFLGVVCLAQAQLSSFPPGTFQNRAALDATAGKGLQTSLSAFYSLETTSWTDDVGSNSLTGNGSPTVTTGIVGNGVNLVSASSQFLSHANAAAFQLGNNFSIQVWVNLASNITSDDFPLISKNDGGFSNREYGMGARFTSANFWSFEIYDVGGTAANVVSSVNMTTGSWFHLVATFDGTTVKFYVNNNSPDTITPSFSIPASTSTFMIGHDGQDLGFVNGVIDQVGLWKGRVLTAGDVALLYNSGAGLSFAAMQ